MKTVIDKSAAVTVRELIEALTEMVGLGLQRDTTYVTINSDSIKLVLVEETLSDSSKVYNIELSEASK